MSHRNARLTVHGRRILVERVQSGRPVAHVAAEMDISRPTGLGRAHRGRSRLPMVDRAGLRSRRCAALRPRSRQHLVAAGRCRGPRHPPGLARRQASGCPPATAAAS
ncbi:leucine zipper domain-containing protein [Streptomyces sp. PTY087I2]|uniref:leucine zipper domain-containing protein n=1 Tax=Streptomyces sp. PTY087I2 TaxID=1819298 RepID=UPI0021004DEB|nr:leucine zipper domain-containing protein [Streptomyces sp. PTY087I2]